MDRTPPLLQAHGCSRRAQVIGSRGGPGIHRRKYGIFLFLELSSKTAVAEGPKLMDLAEALAYTKGEIFAFFCSIRTCLIDVSVAQEPKLLDLAEALASTASCTCPPPGTVSSIPEGKIPYEILKGWLWKQVRHDRIKLIPLQ